MEFVRGRGNRIDLVSMAYTLQAGREAMEERLGFVVSSVEQLAEKLPTSGLVALDFAIDAWSELHPHSGRLERFVTPKSLDTGGW